MAAMTNEQFKELIETLKATPNPPPHHHLINTSPNASIWDVVMKIAIPLMTLGVATLIGSVWNLDKRFSQFEIRQQVQEEVLADFQEFAKEPKFSQEDFVVAIEPLKQQVIINANGLSNLNTNMDKFSNRLNGLENEIALYRQSQANK